MLCTILCKFTLITALTATCRLIQPGVAIGLAWTSAGGEVMFVEASRMGGTGQLTLTGQLGDVMKESATLALNWTRIHSSRFGVTQPDIMEGTDIHVHFPAGAVEKDGPSAGVTIGKIGLFFQFDYNTNIPLLCQTLCVSLE